MRYKGWKNIILYIVSFTLSLVLSKAGHDYLSGFVLIAAALLLYLAYYKESGNLLDFRALLSLSWAGGQGLASLKLSYLETTWETLTWVSFAGFYLCFIAGYEISRLRGEKKALARKEKTALGREEKKAEPDREVYKERLFVCALVLAGCSLAAFILEVAVLGFVPILSDKPHAYSYFHISGVHYFTISCILIPALSVLCHNMGGAVNKKRRIWWLILDVYAFFIPIVCVSRFMMLMGAALAILVYMAGDGKWNRRVILMAIPAMAAVYVGLTFARHHDVEYLNGIFEMKNENMPIFISQPYIYIANNYENFNCLVRHLPEHTYGLKMLFPLFALTGIKFLVPSLVLFPYYLRKEELTTLTIIYDAYYDFGVIGVLVFGFLLGYLCAVIAGKAKEKKNPIAGLLAAQIAMYVILSFFTTWFGNPTTWFWLILTGIMYIYTEKGLHFFRKKKDATILRF